MSALKKHLATLHEKSIAVIGMGVSNAPLIRVLLDEGLEVTVCDKAQRTQIAQQADELARLGASFQLGEDYLNALERFDVIFRTPGLSPNTPQLQKAAENGREITSEMELFFDLCPCKIIAVTGSDGKTTTTTLIAEFLRAAGKTVHLGGNIGKPLLAEVDSICEQDIAVLELSSFQLMSMTRHSPNIAVFTNLSPNHLDYHHTMQEYTAAKMNIFLHQTANDRAIFNYDNEITRALAQQAVAKPAFFSREAVVQQGVYLQDDMIWLANDGSKRAVLPLEDIQLLGVHNIENYMAAIAAVEGLVSEQCMRDVAKRFQGVEHRIELVRTHGGVRYYNDSIGTSPTRTMACLDCFEEKLILIAGGYDKGISFTQLGITIKNKVKTLILIGATAPAILAAVQQAQGDAQSVPAIIHAHTLERAVQAASEVAGEGDVVVLSPACAAFDQFNNFMQRGTRFKELIMQL